MHKPYELLLAAALALAGCNDGAPPANTPPPVTGTTAVSAPAQPPTPSATDLARLKIPDKQEVVLQTGRGKIIFELFPNAAPNHVQRIKELVSKHYYDGILFHRVIPDFMIQFGDPNTRKPDRSMWGQGSNDYPTLKAEFNPLPHVPGTVSMARTKDPDSASTQFFICVGTPSYLNGKYTVFGQVVKGQEIADQISKVARDANDAPLSNEKVSRAYLIPTPKDVMDAAVKAAGPPAPASASPAPAGSASPAAAGTGEASPAPASGSPAAAVSGSPATP